MSVAALRTPVHAGCWARVQGQCCDTRRRRSTGLAQGRKKGGGVCVVQVGRGAARPTSMQSKIIEGFRVQCECVRVRALELPARAAAGTQQRQGPLMSRAAAAGPAWVPGQRVRGRRTQSQSVR